MKKFVVFIVLITMVISTGVKATEVPRESAPVFFFHELCR